MSRAPSRRTQRRWLASPRRAASVCGANSLPLHRSRTGLPGVVATEKNAAELRRDGQSRLSWGATPVDIFLTTDEFHEHVSTRLSLEPFEGVLVPFLSCTDLAVFKAFFDRRRDWANIEEMLVARTIDADAVVAVVADLLGPEEVRIS